MSTILISCAGRTLSVDLFDNPTADDLFRLLPVTVTVDDFNGVEKVGALPYALTMTGVPRGAEPDVNDLGYYAPSRGLVLYYGHVGYWPGIVRLGRLDSADMDFIGNHRGSLEVTLEARTQRAVP